MKKFCASKDTINKSKRQPTEWKKIFANHASDKELISRIYREFLKLNNKILSVGPRVIMIVFEYCPS